MQSEKQGFVIGKFVKYKRTELNLSQRDVAIAIGYKNINRGIKRVNDIELGIIIKEHLEKIISVLNITETEKQKCENYEKQYVNDYVKTLKPFEQSLIVGTSKWSCNSYSVDKEKTLKENIEIAKKLSKKYYHVAILSLNYNLRYYVYSNGEYTKFTVLKTESLSKNLPIRFPVDFNFLGV